MRGTLALASSSIEGGASLPLQAKQVPAPQAVRNTRAMVRAALDGTVAAARDVAQRLKANHFESRVDGKVKQAAIRATA